MTLRDERDNPKKQIVSYHFDSMENDNMTAKQTLCQWKTYFFLDEMTAINGWEKVVKSLASGFTVDHYVTGSSSQMISSEITTYLADRFVALKYGVADKKLD